MHFSNYLQILSIKTILVNACYEAAGVIKNKTIPEGTIFESDTLSIKA
jgi:hypothetical protein